MTVAATRTTDLEDYPGQYRLEYIQLANWGTFGGLTDIPVSRKGFLINGESGTGKSTLVDAISTILVPPGRVSFNAATQHEGRKKDGRSLIGYVRGAWKTVEDSATGDIKETFLRSAATVSVVSLRFVAAPEKQGRGAGVRKVCTLIAFYYVRAGQMADAQISKTFAVVPEDVDIKQVAPHLTGGVDKKKLKKLLPAARFFTDYSKFAAHFRGILGIHSVEAQLLLHRTQSAKSLGSLDQLFRDYMLPVPGTYKLADEAVEQFGELREAYRRVDEVTQQIKVLSPLKELARKREESTATISYATSLQQAVPAVRDTMLREILTNEITAATAGLEDQKMAVEQAEHEREMAGKARDRAKELMQSEQAPAVAQIRADIKLAEQKLKEAEGLRGRAEGYCARLETVPITDAHSYREILAGVAEYLADYPAMIKENRSQLDQLGHAQREAQQEVNRLRTEISSMAARTTNIDSQMIALRALLCQELGLNPELVPYAGELIDIKPGEERWEPVIQRLLGPLANTLLVPDEHRRRVVDWVNSHNLGRRLTLRSVPATPMEPKQVRDNRSLSLKLSVIDHPMQQWLRAHIQQRWQYLCVDSVAELEDARTRAVTVEGMVRYRVDETGSRRYEKDDRHRLGDRRHFSLGSDNNKKLEVLRRLAEERQDTLRHITERRSRVQDRQTTLESGRHAALELQEITWVAIDVDGLKAEIAELQAGLQELFHSPEQQHLLEQLTQAKQRLQRAEEAWDKEKERLYEIRAEVNNLKDQLEQIARPETVDSGVATAVLERIHAKGRRRTVSSIRRFADQVIQDLQGEVSAARGALDKHNAAIAKILGTFLNMWPAENADLSPEAGFVGEGLAILNKLTSQRLAEFRGKFLELMNRTATQNLSQIHNHIRRAKDRIDANLEPINASLQRSEFAPGRFLAIETRDRRGPEVVQFLKDLNAAISGGLNTTDVEVAVQRYHTMAKLLERLGSKESADTRWRRAVLDTRRHVSFVGNEVSADGTVMSTHVNSAQLSGGQAQKLVFFCLAAALRYRLAAPGADWPAFATVVLDEAFDRADAAFTRMAMNIFLTFGFHMILVTPGKQVQTLSPYVGGAAIVTCSYAGGSPQSLITSIPMFTAPPQEQNLVAEERSGEEKDDKAGTQ